MFLLLSILSRQRTRTRKVVKYVRQISGLSLDNLKKKMTEKDKIIADQKMQLAEGQKKMAEKELDNPANLPGIDALWDANPPQHVDRLDALSRNEAGPRE